MFTDSEIDRRLATREVRADILSTANQDWWKLVKGAVEGVKLYSGVRATMKEADIAEANAKRRLQASLRVANLKGVQASLQETSLGRQTIYNRNNFKDYNSHIMGEYQDNLDRISNNFARNGVDVNSDASMMAIGRVTAEFEKKSDMAKRLYNESNFELLTQAKTEIEYLRQSEKIDKDNATQQEQYSRNAIRQTKNLDILMKTLSTASTLIDTFTEEGGSE